MPPSVDLALGRTTPDDSQPPDRPAEPGIDLALITVIGKPNGLNARLREAGSKVMGILCS